MPGVICFSALRSTVPPHERLIADLSNHQQTTTGTPSLPLGGIKAQYLEQLDTNCVWEGPTLRGNGRSQWPKKVTMLRIRGRTLGSDPELNRAEIQSEHHLPTNSTLKRLTKTRERAVPPVYEEHLRVLFSCSQKWAFRLFACFCLRFRFDSSSSASWQAKMHWNPYTSRNSTHFQVPRSASRRFYIYFCNLATLALLGRSPEM